MPKLEKPRIGDIVYFIHRETERAAIVVLVDDDGTTVSLNVFSSTHCGSRMEHKVPYSPGIINGTWRWRE